MMLDCWLSGSEEILHTPIDPQQSVSKIKLQKDYDKFCSIKELVVPTIFEENDNAFDDEAVDAQGD
jgi:hypothetical protein